MTTLIVALILGALLFFLIKNEEKESEKAEAYLINYQRIVKEEYDRKFL